MAQLFDRRVRLTIGKEPPTGDFVRTVPDAAVITGLRVVFKIEKTSKPEPNKASVQVYNLSPTHRADLVGKGLRIVLEAGYPDSLAVIYQGHTRTADHIKQPVDWLSKFECGTNEREIGFARISESFKPGAAIADMIKKTVNALVTDPGNALKKANELTQSFASGYAAHGYAATELTRLLQPFELTWSIQDGRMQILGLTETVADETIKLDANHGLIGTPELGSPVIKGGPNLVKMRSLLQAGFGPGKRILLTTAATGGNVHSGLYKAVNVTHAGDTHGGPWVSEIEALPI